MSSSHWSRGLLEAIADPERWLVSTKDLVAIKDKFPKAKYHFLVVPLAAIDSIFDLTRDDIDMLREMKFLAQSVVQVHGRTIDEFKIGYHAKPSMQRVHLHVISRDFHSPCLKTKKHWNSFNTPFLLSTEYVIDQLEQSGRVQKLQEQTIKDYLASPLKCNSCQARLRNIPELKEHLARHIAAPIAGNDS